jgi:hypothetical protein
MFKQNCIIILQCGQERIKYAPVFFPTNMHLKTEHPELNYWEEWISKVENYAYTVNKKNILSIQF